ncbi:hypothetical protein F4553_000584 [Allocatelliglobosispora scoriae]|uniref:DUF4037 domain-containing protein n=1 Tax=Allocatelliglobosispora scoriae TaxID=643052 RepID=A0A841BHV4_9ACTN|nr:DUF4037 domain-containing protein [Allocatelliglobosispora scoriae]MBB5867205.1 hypothetical protein [Allocatelliglobosispora scoriae]
MTGAGPGISLAERFYREAVAPLLGRVPHGAALLGDGSEVLGFDDGVSTDHDFGPRVQLFLPPGTDPAPVHRLLGGLPERFEGFPVAYVDTDSHDGQPSHQVEVTTAAAFFAARTGTDPADGMGVADWLLTPTQILGSLTAGEVFADPDRALEIRRAALSWYPDDVWRYALAAGWLRIAQEEAFTGRTGSTGDDLGSRVVAARLVRDLMRLAFLAERRWAPYGKWFGRAFAGLPVAASLTGTLDTALAATDWREREHALAAAACVVAAATNELGLCPPVDPSPRRYYTRDIEVVGADRFTVALTAAITDPVLRGVLDRLGHRHGGPVGTLPGTVDQAVDSADILCHPDRCRALAPVLGLV